jgi:hypothetical protein
LAQEGGIMMASDPDIMDERNELSLKMFEKPIDLLTPEEMDMLNDEVERLMQKFSSAPDPMDERNSVMEMLSERYYGKPLKDLTDDEFIDLEEALEDLTGKKERSAPSMMMAANGGRAQYGLGSLVKSVKKAVKGVVKGVKDNPLLAAAALNFAPMLAGAKPFIGMGSLAGSKFTLPGFSGLLGLKEGADAMNALKVGGASAVITGLLASKERQPNESDADFAERTAQVRDQLNVQFRRLYPQGGNESDEDYNVRINALVEGADDSTIPVGEMADGGRVGYASGSEDRFMELVSELRERGFSQQEAIEEARRILSEDKAMGGRVMRAMGDSASDNAVQAAGIEGLPLRQNSKGVKEIDLRKTGGFIPPVGIKEKADDIPAMLSNNEFVMTADAVRAAGGGSVNKGAQRMYDLMKNLESRVV